MAWRPVEPALSHPIDWPVAVRLAVIGALIGAGLVVLATVATPTPGPNSGGGYTPIFANPTTRFGVVLNHADGQAYAALARDPLLRHPEYFAGHGVGAAPFLPRPLMPHLLWLLSLGRPADLPAAFVLVEGLAGFLLVLGGAALLQGTGRPGQARLALVAMVLPSTVAAVVFLGQDVLALGLLLVGIAAWCRPRAHWAVGLVLLTAAGLTRETMLVMVAALAMYGSVARGPRRRDLGLIVPFVAYEAWSVWANGRYHLRNGRGLLYNLGAPFVGVVRAATGWSWAGRFVLFATLLLIVAALVRPAHSLLAWLLAGFALASTVAGKGVWLTWGSGVRVIAPAAVVALLTLRIPAGAAEPSPSASGSAGTAEPRSAPGLPISPSDP